MATAVAAKVVAAKAAAAVEEVEVTEAARRYKRRKRCTDDLGNDFAYMQLYTILRSLAVGWVVLVNKEDTAAAAAVAAVAKAVVDLEVAVAVDSEETYEGDERRTTGLHAYPHPQSGGGVVHRCGLRSASRRVLRRLTSCVRARRPGKRETWVVAVEGGLFSRFILHVHVSMNFLKMNFIEGGLDVQSTSPL